jgi:hypothetical protein
MPSGEARMIHGGDRAPPTVISHVGPAADPVPSWSTTHALNASNGHSALPFAADQGWPAPGSSGWCWPDLVLGWVVVIHGALDFLVDGGGRPLPPLSALSCADNDDAPKRRPCFEAASFEL